MTHYIKSMIIELDHKLSNVLSSEGIASRFQTLIAEIERLDPRDFTPAHRFEFVNLRRKLSNYSQINDDDWSVVGRLRVGPHPRGTSGSMLSLLRKVELSDTYGIWAKQPDNSGCNAMAQGLVGDTQTLLSQLSNVLESYLGPDVRMKVRDFPYIRNPELRHIVERDYHELTVRLFPIEAWKSVVIISGSILEALLHDLLTRDATRSVSAMAASRSPKKNVSGARTVRDIQSDASEDQWMLNDYIEVADELALLPADWKKSVQAVLRDFRNCVHPRKELKMSEKITQGEAFQAVGTLIRICDYIEKSSP